MDELRKNHIVQLELSDKNKIDGIVVDYSYDRVLVLISPQCQMLASKICELDEIKVIASTHLGLKKMISNVITPLKDGHITIENNPSIPVVQKREFVRVLSSINFKIQSNNGIFDAMCLNISAGGVAFCVNDTNFEIDEDVKIYYSENDFGKNIECSAKIIKKNEFNYVAKHLDLNSHDEDKIVKYVFKMIAKK